ncbi:ABC transporter permease [Brachybacterium sacelli]|uniref:Peptide/nickel transport system permease protein n=1 Tax=Brachybacterium sacelli TaxID=173364 RepID=A0ABS4WYB9_9MICO|nr:ABC transporter permease [Brachybacterium sacelli]MBP2381153.1 peptide/nickel transport system permease protein [Brachybacterium sacelli]
MTSTLSRFGAAVRRTSTPSLVIGVGLVVVIVLFGLLAPFVVDDPLVVHNYGMQGPSAEHLLGTTQTGQDVLAQLAWATRGSLLVGVIVAVLALFLSAFFGILGGYLGGWLDEVFSLFTNVVLILPGLPLMIVIGSYVQQRGLLLIAVILAITSWAAAARVLRSQTLSIRSRDYVQAAKIAGEKPHRIIAVEILPNLLPVMSSGFVFALITAILGEAGLSFIGLGVVGTQTWGSMLFYAQNGQALTLGAWWWFVPPGLMIALLGCGLSLINFSIDGIINPRLRSAPKQVKQAKRATKAQKAEAMA